MSYTGKVVDLQKGNPTCHLYYVTTGQWTKDANLTIRAESEVKQLQEMRLFSKVEFTPIDAEQIQKLYNQSRNKIQERI